VSEEKFRAEVLRINTRYLVEIVEEYDFCPWAKRVRGTPRFRREILWGDSDNVSLHEKIGRYVEEIAQTSEVEIALLIFPKLKLSARDFRSLVAVVGKTHAALHPRGELPLAMACFHPSAEADMQTAARLVPFIRRSPDPTIQLVRRETIAKVSNADSASGGSVFADNLESFLPLLKTPPKPSLTDRIAQTNLDTVSRVSATHIESILADIAADRDRSYTIADSVDS